jgi:hypothetical protein
MKENKLVWIAVLFVVIVTWLVLDQPKYEKQVNDLGERIKDHVASIETVKQGMDRFDAQWKEY